MLHECGFTCSKCGRQGGRLELHHRKPWKKHPEIDFFDRRNLEVLCVHCHSEITRKEHKPSDPKLQALDALVSELL